MEWENKSWGCLREKGWVNKSNDIKNGFFNKTTTIYSEDGDYTRTVREYAKGLIGACADDEKIIESLDFTSKVSEHGTFGMNHKDINLAKDYDARYISGYGADAVSISYVKVVYSEFNGRHSAKDAKYDDRKGVNVYTILGKTDFTLVDTVDKSLYVTGFDYAEFVKTIPTSKELQAHIDNAFEEMSTNEKALKDAVKDTDMTADVAKANKDKLIGYSKIAYASAKSRITAYREDMKTVKDILEKSK